MSFHPALRDHLLLAYAKEVYVVDLEIGQIVGYVSSSLNGNDSFGERTASAFCPIVQINPCKQRDALYLLHENGTITLRSRKGTFQKAYPAIHNIPRSNTFTSSSMTSSWKESKEDVYKKAHSPDNSNADFLLRDDASLEIHYDLKSVTCDSAIRMASGGKGTKVSYDNLVRIL